MSAIQQNVRMLKIASMPLSDAFLRSSLLLLHDCQHCIQRWRYVERIAD
jgi:hypothetical protein